MRVLAVIITSPSYAASGAVTAAKNLSRATADLCEMQLAIMANDNKEEQVDNLIIKHFKCSNRLPMFADKTPNQIKNSFWTSNIGKYIEEFKPDVVHFHNPVPPLALWDLAKVCLKNKIPYVISSHGFVEMFDYKKSYNIGFLKGLAINPMILNPFMKTLENAASIFLLSPNEREILENNMNFKRKISVIPNGYDKMYEKNANNEVIAECKIKFNIQANKPIFLYIGNHTYNKGIDILLNSLRYIEEDCQIIIGGKIRSKKDNQALIDSCSLSEDESRFIFTDFLSDDEAIALYHLADCFIFPTRADTFPLVILEAMISGLPVISTKVGGIPYQINSNCGVLIEPDSPKELASSVEDFINNPTRMNDMGVNAKDRVMSNFTWEKSANIAFDAYNELLSK